MAYQRTPYENYILISEHTKLLRGTYQNFVRLKELMSTLNSMVAKQSNTYTYNGEVFVSKLTGSEINKIQSALDIGVYNSSVEMLKHIFIDIVDRDF